MNFQKFFKEAVKDCVMKITIKRKNLKPFKCPNCKTKLSKGSIFCQNCGEKIEVDEILKKEKIVKLVEKYSRKLDVGYYSVLHTYKDIDDKHKKNLLKFDKNLYVGDFACILDRSILHSCKEGLLFMLSGFYYHIGPFSGADFFKYSDIGTMTPMDIDKLRIYFKDNSYKEISVIWYAEPLKELLEKIIEIDRLADTSYTNQSKSGHTSGIFSRRNRKSYFEGQISGYNRCSREYEAKLRRQADLFLNTTNKWKQERFEYEQLLDEYEKTIEELERQIEKSPSAEYENRLEHVKETEQRLRKLSE